MSSHHPNAGPPLTGGYAMVSSLAEALDGRYRVQRVLGRGGMSTVYLGRDLKVGRPVCIKMLDPELSVTLAAERFLCEIRITANLQHPHVLTLLDSGDANGFLYYVMPYVEGASLRERLEAAAQLAVQEAIEITRQLACALDHAHGQGIIHRDVKPDNVLLRDGQAMLADFGVALAIGLATDERLTKAGRCPGTPAYMSPEQARAEPDLDARSDIYSLGCVLYEMLAGEPPFTGTTPRMVMVQHRDRPPPSLSTVRPDVLDWLQAVVHQALAKTPAERFQSARAFARALGPTAQGSHAIADRDRLRRRWCAPFSERVRSFLAKRRVLQVSHRLSG